MKKLLSLLFVIMMCLSLCACSAKEETANMPNPMVEYNSLDEINDKIGSLLIKPAVMGVSDEKFFVIDEKLADYRFTVNGLEYAFRASKDLSKDISGVYVGEGTMFEGEADYDSYFDDTQCGVRFVLNDVQYTLTTVHDGKLTEDQFYSIADELHGAICISLSDPAIASLAGDYADSVSQRANATIDIFGINELVISINWANSADSEDEWYIVTTYKDGKLEYGSGDIWHGSVTYGEDGEIADVVDVNDAIPGYFEVIDGKVCWTGAGIENLEKCVFEKF